MFARTAIIVLLLGPAAAPAYAAVNTPARFSGGEDGLAQRIEFPEVKGDGKITLRCAAKVRDDGDMDDNGCYLDDNNAGVFMKAINAAARKAKMIPAVIDGKKRDVYVQYRVEFRTADGKNSITIYNNPGVRENVEAYGDDHIAAQRALTRETWQKECPRHTRFLVWAKAHVAPDGEQSNISLAPNEGAPITRDCEQAIIATLAEAGFAPALDGTEPVPSSYVEPFGN